MPYFFSISCPNCFMLSRVVDFLIRNDPFLISLRCERGLYYLLYDSDKMISHLCEGNRRPMFWLTHVQVALSVLELYDTSFHILLALYCVHFQSPPSRYVCFISYQKAIPRTNNSTIKTIMKIIMLSFLQLRGGY